MQAAAAVESAAQNAEWLEKLLGPPSWPGRAAPGPRSRSEREEALERLTKPKVKPEEKAAEEEAEANSSKPAAAQRSPRTQREACSRLAVPRRPKADKQAKEQQATMHQSAPNDTIASEDSQDAGAFDFSAYFAAGGQESCNVDLYAGSAYGCATDICHAGPSSFTAELVAGLSGGALVAGLGGAAEAAPGSCDGGLLQAYEEDWQPQSQLQPQPQPDTVMIPSILGQFQGRLSRIDEEPVDSHYGAVQQRGNCRARRPARARSVPAWDNSGSNIVGTATGSGGGGGASSSSALAAPYAAPVIPGVAVPRARRGPYSNIGPQVPSRVSCGVSTPSPHGSDGSGAREDPVEHSPWGGEEMLETIDKLYAEILPGDGTASRAAAPTAMEVPLPQPFKGRINSTGGSGSSSCSSQRRHKPTARTSSTSSSTAAPVSMQGEHSVVPVDTSSRSSACSGGRREVASLSEVSVVEATSSESNAPPRDASDDEEDCGDDAILECIDELYSQMLGGGSCPAADAECSFAHEQKAAGDRSCSRTAVLQAALVKPPDDAGAEGVAGAPAEEVLAEVEREHGTEDVPQARARSERPASPAQSGAAEQAEETQEAQDTAAAEKELVDIDCGHDIEEMQDGQQCEQPAKPEQQEVSEQREQPHQAQESAPVEEDRGKNPSPMSKTGISVDDLRELLQETLWSAMLVTRGAGDQLDVEARLLKLLPPHVLGHCLRVTSALPGSLMRQLAPALPGLHAALEAASTPSEDELVPVGTVPVERLAAVVRVARDYVLKMACLPEVAAKALESRETLETPAADSDAVPQEAASAVETTPQEKVPTKAIGASAPGHRASHSLRSGGGVGGSRAPRARSRARS